MKFINIKFVSTNEGGCLLIMCQQGISRLMVTYHQRLDQENSRGCSAESTVHTGYSMQQKLNQHNFS